MLSSLIVHYEIGPDILQLDPDESCPPVAEQVKAPVGSESVWVMGFPLDACRKWPKCNDLVLCELNVPAGHI